MTARLSFITIETFDVERTARFYRALGVELADELNYGPKHHVFPAPVDAEFYPVTDEDGGNGVMLGIDTDDLEALFARVEPDAIIKPIGDYRGIRRFMFRDCDGRRVYVREIRPER